MVGDEMSANRYILIPKEEFIYINFKVKNIKP